MPLCSDENCWGEIRATNLPPRHITTICFLFQRNTFHKRIRKSQSSHALKIPTIFHRQSKDLTLTINFFLKIAKQEQLMFS